MRGVAGRVDGPCPAPGRRSPGDHPDPGEARGYGAAMAYPPDLLGPNEKIVLDLRPHWWFLVPRIGLLLLVVAVGTMVWVNIEQSAIEGLMGVGVLVALGFFGIRYARWATTSFVVTTDRVLFRQGLLTKTGIEIPLERINTVVFNQRFFERLIGAGDLEIQSAGETPSMISAGVLISAKGISTRCGSAATPLAMILYGAPVKSLGNLMFVPSPKKVPSPHQISWSGALDVWFEPTFAP